MTVSLICPQCGTTIVGTSEQHARSQLAMHQGRKDHQETKTEIVTQETFVERQEHLSDLDGRIQGKLSEFETLGKDYDAKIDALSKEYIAKDESLNKTFEEKRSKLMDVLLDERSQYVRGTEALVIDKTRELQQTTIELANTTEALRKLQSSIADITGLRNDYATALKAVEDLKLTVSEKEKAVREKERAFLEFQENEFQLKLALERLKQARKRRR